MNDRIWIDCATCGSPKRPEVIESERRHVSGMTYTHRTVRTWINVRDGKNVEVAKCGTCGAVDAVRRIKVRGNGESGRPCGAACLSGKRSCDCKCGGRCHGAGRCHCTAAA